MSPFDEQFADRVREVFDAYAEPVDEPTWERVQTTLATHRAPARDRAPIAGMWVRRSRALVALATLVLVAGVGTWVWQSHPADPTAETATVHTDAAPSVPVRPAPPAASALGQSAPPQDSPGDGEALAPSPQPTAPLLAQGSPRTVSPTPVEAPARRRSSGVPLRDEAAPAAQIGMADAETAMTEAETAMPAPTARPSASEPSPAAAGAPAPLDLAQRSPQLDAAPAPALARMDADEANESGWNEDIPESASAPSRAGIDLVLATNAAFSGRQLADGGGLTAGLSREWRLRNGLAISTGALTTYTRLETDPDASINDALTSFESDPSRPVEVPNQTTLSTLALEVPIDLVVDVVDAGRGRIRVGAGLTTSLYLAQTFEDEGERYALDTEINLSGESTVTITSDAYSSTETAGPLSRLDLGRQANVSLGYTLDRGRTPLSVDAYTRLPLGGVTSRELSLTIVGLRLRVGL